MLFYYLENVRLWYKPKRSKNNRSVWGKINESKLLDRKILHSFNILRFLSSQKLQNLDALKVNNSSKSWPCSSSFVKYSHTAY